MGKSNRKPKAKTRDVVGQMHTRLRHAASEGTAIQTLGSNNLLGGLPPLSKGKLGFNRSAVPEPDPDLGAITSQDILDRARVADRRHGQYTQDEVELITQNPKLAIEGLARMGQVLAISHDQPTMPFDSLEIKARVIADLRAGRFKSMWGEERPEWSEATVEYMNQGVSINVQAVYDRWINQSKGNDLYELRLAPPWTNAVLVYNNEAGNVWVMHLLASDIRTDDDWKPEFREEIAWQPQSPATHGIDWDRVRWVYSVQVYCGGQTGMGEYMRAMGPLMIWRLAIYDDGEPADVHWTHIAKDTPIHKFNNALGTLTETINMSNCANVHVAESTRPMTRPQRRRLDRLGVRFSEIHIRPVSKSYRGLGTALADMEMPLHGVKGHYATYGQDGRGLLFGRYSGRFWIPPHIRGSREAGAILQSYVAEE